MITDELACKAFAQAQSYCASEKLAAGFLLCIEDFSTGCYSCLPLSAEGDQLCSMLAEVKWITMCVQAV